VTHFANVTPIKSAPPVIGAGELLTYVIEIFNRGLATEAAPILTDVIPLSTTFQWASDDGVLVPADPEFVSWTLPLLSPGEGVVEPVLKIVKSDSPDPVVQGSELEYTIRVINLGRQATGLVITDIVPVDTEYVEGSATGGGQLVGGQVQWGLSVLTPGESQTLSFRVTVLGGERIVNDDYAVRSAEGAVGIGAPVVTMVVRTSYLIYLPLVAKNY